VPTSLSGTVHRESVPTGLKVEIWWMDIWALFAPQPLRKNEEISIYKPSASITFPDPALMILEGIIASKFFFYSCLFRIEISK
jgi:hypothetical protein